MQGRTTQASSGVGVLDDEARPAVEQTVMFIDVVSSTEILEQCGDAAWLRRLDRHTRAMHSIVQRHGGELCSFLGDGFMILFDDPGDAVVCSLKMQTAAAVQDLFMIRIGIDHGPVLAYGDSWHVGLTIHIASRLTDQCRPGEVVLSDRCYRLARDNAAVPPVRTTDVQIRGLQGLMTVHAVIGEKP